MNAWFISVVHVFLELGTSFSTGMGKQSLELVCTYVHFVEEALPLLSAAGGQMHHTRMAVVATAAVVTPARSPIPRI
jgi:hypothetical protein